MMNENLENQKYIYEFIPYEKIGPITLNKTDETTFELKDVKYLGENSFNHVLCKPTFIDNPYNIKKGRNNDELIIVVDGINIKINGYYEQVLESLKKVSNDFVEYDDPNFDIPTKGAYSKNLGITILAQKYEDYYCIYSLVFLGKNEFEKAVDDIKYNLSKPVITITSKLSKFVMNDDLNKEYTQTIEIRDNSAVIFDAYNFENIQKRHEYLVLNNQDINLILNDIKNTLDLVEPYPITKDGDNWKIEININGDNYCYSGDILDIKEENKKISMYIRNIIKLDDLILLDGNK